MLFVAIACLRALELDEESQPLMSLLDEFLALVLNTIGAGVLFGAAWLIAVTARAVARKALNLGDADWRLGLQRGALENTISTALFRFILLFFLPGVLGSLQLANLTAPVQQILDEILAFIPNLISGVIIVGVFYFIAQLASTIVHNVLSAGGFEDIPNVIGLAGGDTQWNIKPSELISKLSLIVILFFGWRQAFSSLELAVFDEIFK